MTKTFGKTCLVAHIAQAVGLPRNQVDAVLQHLAQAIHTEAAAGNTVVLPGVGRFQQKHRAARTGRHPQTGQPIDIPASTVLGFKPSKSAS
jgi:nucleoid DNA-binding protein